MRKRRGPARRPIHAVAAVLAAFLLAGASILPFAARAADEPASTTETPAEDSLIRMPLVVPGPEPQIIFLFTGQVSGYVEPCGCPKNPAGGLPRRAGYVDLLEDEFPDAKVILLELGEFASLFNPPGRLKIEAYVDAMKELKYEVVAVGERELAGGLDEFDRYIGGSGLDITSASYTKRGSDDLLAQPFVIREYDLGGKNPFRIGYISLSSYNSLLAVTGKDRTAVVSRNPVEQALRYVPELRGKVDFLVLLANLGPNDLEKIAAALPGQIDLALGGFSDRISPKGFEIIGGIKTFYAGHEGRRLGEVRLYLDESGILSDIKPFQVHLTRRYPADRKLGKRIDKLLAEVNDLMKSMPSSVAAAMATNARARGQATREKLLTAKACVSCHQEAFRIWEGSGHAHAMETLVKANQDYNPECVQCHTTGFGAPSGFVSMRESPQLSNVQCESCHGSAAAHLQNPAEPYGSVSPRVCHSCHTKENSPDFSFFKYWSSIEH